MREPQPDPNERRQRELNEEANEILRSRVEHINEQYLRVREAYRTPYDWPELDPLRVEIALGITLGLYQSAIALTNHLVESLMKNALIVHHSLPSIRAQRGGVITALVAGTAEARARFGDMDLSKTISAARRAGLITKEQQKQLHFARERFRNAYSHADKGKAFGAATVPTQGVRAEDGELVVTEEAEPMMAELIVGQGIAQAISARANAADYFLLIDDIARGVRAKVFPSTPPSPAGPPAS